MIELRKLAVIDLSVTYARQMGENKIRHYRVPASSLVMSKFTGDTPETLVVRHIRETEGVAEDESIAILPEKNGTPFFRNGSSPTDGAMLQVKDVTHIILKNYPEIEFSLAKRSIKKLVHEYNEDPTPIRSRYLSPVTTFINRGICKINEVLRRFQMRNVDTQAMDRFEYLDLKIFQVPLLPMYGLIRRYSVCSFLTVAFEEDDIQEATAQLISDLKILNDNELIVGNLCMPSMILLADTVGSGKSVCSLFCFLFVDKHKLSQLVNIPEKDLPRESLHLLGVKSETPEGGISYLNGVSPLSKYAIETVDVIIGTPEYGRQAHIANYEDTLDQVNDIAKKAKKAIEEVEVVNKRSNTVYTDTYMRGTAVAVNADLVNKDGEAVSLEDLYNKNKDRQ